MKNRTKQFIIPNPIRFPGTMRIEQSAFIAVLLLLSNLSFLHVQGYDAREVPSPWVPSTIIVDPNGNTIAWGSSGGQGFKGSRKSTPFAAQITANAVARNAQEHGLMKVDVRVKGVGSGRETAVRSLQAAGLEIGTIIDVTPVPHNGCRQRRRRRP